MSIITKKIMWLLGLMILTVGTAFAQHTPNAVVPGSKGNLPDAPSFVPLGGEQFGGLLLKSLTWYSAEMTFPTLEKLGKAEWCSMQYRDHAGGDWTELPAKIYDSGIATNVYATMDFDYNEIDVRAVLQGGDMNGYSSNVITVKRPSKNSYFKEYTLAKYSDAMVGMTPSYYLGYQDIVTITYPEAGEPTEETFSNELGYHRLQWYRYDPETYDLTKIDKATEEHYTPTIDDWGYGLMLSVTGDEEHCSFMYNLDFGIVGLSILTSIEKIYVDGFILNSEYVLPDPENSILISHGWDPDLENASKPEVEEIKPGQYKVRTGNSNMQHALLMYPIEGYTFAFSYDDSEGTWIEPAHMMTHEMGAYVLVQPQLNGEPITADVQVIGKGIDGNDVIAYEYSFGEGENNEIENGNDEQVDGNGAMAGKTRRSARIRRATRGDDNIDYSKMAGFNLMEGTYRIRTKVRDDAVQTYYTNAVTWSDATPIEVTVPDYKNMTEEEWNNYRDPIYTIDMVPFPDHLAGQGGVSGSIPVKEGMSAEGYAYLRNNGKIVAVSQIKKDGTFGFGGIPYGEFEVMLDMVGMNMPEYPVVSLSETAPTVANLDFDVVNSEIVMKGNALFLAAVDENNQQIRGEYDVIWFNANKEAIATGKSIRGREDGEQLYYSVLPGRELSEQFRDLEMQPVTFKDGNITCQLEKMTKVTIKGLVSAVDIDRNEATVTIEQLLNSRYEKSFSTRTQNGVFEIEVFDDVTEITIHREDCADATIKRERFGESNDVGTIPLSLLAGVYFTVDLTYKTAATDPTKSETLTMPGGLGDFDVTITNGGTELTDYVVQNSSILIKSGAATGDALVLTLKNKQGIYADATKEFTVAVGPNNVTVEATELGGINATSTSWNQSDVGYVYDANGALAARLAYAGDALSVSHLPAGNYTLVSMMKSQILGNVQTLATLESIGLKTTDYVKSDVTVQDGVIATVTVGEIPTFDESAISCITENSYFNADKTTTYVGNYLTFTSHIDLKPNVGEFSSIALLVDLPEGCAMEGTNAAVGRQNVAFSKTGNRVTIPLTTENYTNKIRFCAAPVVEKNMTLTAYVKIGESIVQPIGSVQFAVKGFPISAPLKASSEKIKVTGTAPAAGDIKIYDGDALIGSTSASWKGQQWNAECILANAFDNTYHTIYAKITTANGEFSSETKSVEFDPNVNAPAKSTIIYYNREFDNTYNIVFDYKAGTTSDSYYYFYPFKYDDWWQRDDKEDKSFTFTADFTVNDPEKIKNVDFKILASDGSVRTLPGSFDNAKHAWVATSKYSSNRLPVNVALDYDMLVASGTNHENGLMDQGNSLVNLSSQISQYLQSKVTATKVSEDAKSLAFNLNVTVGNIPVPFLGKIEEINFTDVQTLMSTQQFNYVTTAAGTIGSYAEWDNTGVKATFCDLDKQYAVKATLTMKDDVNWTLDKNYVTITTLSQLFSNDGFIKVLGDYGYKLISITGAADLFNVRKDFENMMSIVNGYSSNYDLQSTTLKAALNAKCNDGSKRLTVSQIEQYTNDIEKIDAEAAVFTTKFNDFLKVYQQKMLNDVVTNASSAVVSLVFNIIEGLTEFQSNKANALLLAQLTSANSGEMTAAILSNALGVALKNIQNNVTTVYTADQFKKTKDYVLEWSADNHLAILNKYADLKADIRSHYGRCDNLVDLDEFIEHDGMFTTPSTQPMLDPSGYVYEGVLSNRLPGVTTTVYYKGNEGNPVKWDAENYGQANPLVTDANGFYKWDVPNGEWQVKYEKEGYETVISDWLPVPPPQLDVNQNMVSAAAPEVKGVKGYEDALVIDMTKYMKAASFTDGTITVTRNGAAEKGKIEMADPEGMQQSDNKLASKVKFVPETKFQGSDVVTVTVHKEVLSYSDKPMADDYEKTVPIEVEVKQIVTDEEMTVNQQGTKQVSVSVLPKDAAAGKKLIIKTSSADIVALDKDQADIDENGKVSFTMTGGLLGEAYVTFEVVGTDVKETTKVTVVEGTATETAPITIGKSGKASYCGSKSLDFSFSDDIKAYIATGFDKDEGTIWLTRVKDVPAGVPVLIKGEKEKTYQVPVTDSENSYYTNMFVGNTSGASIEIYETSADGSKVNYYLKDGTFLSVTGNAKIGKNKCYLQLPATFNASVTGASQSVTVSSTGKASFAAPVDLDFTNVEGLKVFTATGYDKSTKTIWLTRVMKVQQGEGVLLKGDPDNYEIPSVAAQSHYENMFVGNTSGATIEIPETSADGSQTNYYLKNGTFLSVTGNAKIGNNKCYLALPTSMVAGAASTRGSEESYKFEEPEMIKLPISFRSLGNDGDGTTGIKVQSSKFNAPSDNAYYTLQGQRVQNPGKGLYIKNGRKVVIK